ncbi:hypothetical protein SH2C18_23190 [Clostridium sediminicola]|uniref:hypothetical protein n=1 Tax=Clostridium sediminicola TaxID=3114879 RepID=UPI0031F27EE6
MKKQLMMELTEIEIIDELTTENDESDNQECLLYKKRLKKLITDVAESDDFVGIQSTKDGFDRLQATSKYLTIMLIYNIIDQLRHSNKKQIKPTDVDKALDKILANSSAIDTILEMLKEDIKNLKELNNSAAVFKTSKFINDLYI